MSMQKRTVADQDRNPFRNRGRIISRDKKTIRVGTSRYRAREKLETRNICDTGIQASGVGAEGSRRTPHKSEQVLTHIVRESTLRVLLKTSEKKH